MVDHQRRRFLTLSGTALATGLAGCGGNNGDNTPSHDEDGSNSEEATSNHETRIEFIEQNNIQTIPIVTENNTENLAGVELEVEDQDGLEIVTVSYNDADRDEPYLLYDKTGDELENGKMVPLSEEFPQRLLAPKTGEFQVEVTDVNGNMETRNQEIHNLNASYRADRKRKADNNSETENIGNYSTERNWDDLVTNTQELRETQQRVLQEQAYTPLINQVMTGEDLSSRGELFPNWEGEDDGFFDQDAVKEEEDFENLIRWYLPAIMDHDDQNYGNAPSGRNHRFAATLETLINEHHPSAEAVSTSVKAFPAHGIFGVQDTKDEEFYLVDTTSSGQFDEAVGRIGEFITSENGNRSDLWDPFHSFEPGPQENLHYEGKSEYSMGALLVFSATNEMGDNVDQMFITDEWMDDAYQVLRNGGSIDPIVEPIKELQYNAPQLEDNQKIGIYGTLDDTRIAVDSTNEIYETIMYDETQTPGIEEIENMLQAS